MAEHGIEGFGDDRLDRFEGTGGRVTRVVTKSGRQLDADAVVIGIGAVPDVRLARTAGLEIGDGGGVVVDSRLQTAMPGTFAAGDIAEYESVVHGGERIRIEHGDVALNHGKTAALNMLGRDQPHDVGPYFFSDLSDWASLEYIGPTHDWDQGVVRGSLDEGEFAIFYLRDGRVKAALSVGRSDDLEHARRLLVSGIGVAGRVGELADASSDLSSF
jgi:3-phenylpropionate/trans-cinnamate dioxygenase ferredoxin reductase component